MRAKKVSISNQRMILKESGNLQSVHDVYKDIYIKT